MQKIAKRASQASRQAQRRLAQDEKRKQIYETLRSRKEAQRANQEIRQNVADARKARRDAWELGPLAPKRDLGFNGYGLVNVGGRLDWSSRQAVAVTDELVEKRCAWAGGSKNLNLMPKDRVVLLAGPDKGKIDRIKEINIATGSVTLENFHHGVSASDLSEAERPRAMPIPVSSIRLVYPLRDPNTGITRDVIINELKVAPPNMKSPNMTLDRWEFGKKWDRIVPSLNVVIPWPVVEAPKYELNEIDTPRDIVEDRTFLYSLLQPPMPDKVLDELRGKFSKFRTRHEASYIAKKEAQAAAKKSAHEALLSMQTPLQEFFAKKREEKAAQGEPELSEAMLEKLGEIMAAKQGEELEKAGVSKVSSPPPSQ